MSLDQDILEIKDLLKAMPGQFAGALALNQQGQQLSHIQQPKPLEASAMNRFLGGFIGHWAPQLGKEIAAPIPQLPIAHPLPPAPMPVPKPLPTVAPGIQVGAGAPPAAAMPGNYVTPSPAAQQLPPTAPAPTAPGQPAAPATITPTQGASHTQQTPPIFASAPTVSSYVTPSPLPQASPLPAQAPTAAAAPLRAGPSPTALPQAAGTAGALDPDMGGTENLADVLADLVDVMKKLETAVNKLGQGGSDAGPQEGGGFTPSLGPKETKFPQVASRAVPPARSGVMGPWMSGVQRAINRG